MRHRVSTERLWIEIVLAAAIGTGELVLMKLFDTHPSVGFYEFVYPLLVGALLGAVGGAPVWIIGPATMLCLPIAMAVNIVAGGDGFNQWPLSLIFLGVLALIGLIGAAIGRGVKRYWIHWSVKHNA